MFNANFRVARPRIIVFGNEKGGTGKSTLAMHLAIALLNRGMTVATLDLDAEQRSLSRYIANRRRYRTRTQTELAVPTHLGLGTEQGQIGGVEVANAIDYFRGHDAIIVDTPGYFTTLAQAGHLKADVLITPVNDSFVDLDVLRAGPHKEGLSRPTAYGERIRDLRNDRARGLDWIVVRNRLNTLAARNKRNVGNALDELSRRLGFRLADGIIERVIYRELFLDGLTVEDLPALSEAGPVSLSHVAARQELRNLVACVGTVQRQAA